MARERKIEIKTKTNSSDSELRFQERISFSVKKRTGAVQKKENERFFDTEVKGWLSIQIDFKKLNLSLCSCVSS